MGKIMELLLRRQQELKQHLAKPVPPPGPQPAEAFDY